MKSKVGLIREIKKEEKEGIGEFFEIWRSKYCKQSMLHIGPNNIQRCHIKLNLVIPSIKWCLKISVKNFKNRIQGEANIVCCVVFKSRISEN